MCRPPVARTDRDERLERSRPCRERRGHGEGIGAAPTGAEERALPAMLLECLCLAGQRLQAVVVGDAGLAPVAGFDLVGDVPEKYGIAAHAIDLRCSEDGIWTSLVATGIEQSRLPFRGNEGHRSRILTRLTADGPDIIYKTIENS